MRKKDITEQRKEILYEYYKDYFDFYKMEKAVQLIFRAPDANDITFMYQIKFVRWYLLKVLNLDLADASDCFDLWMSRTDYKRKSNKEIIIQASMDNFCEQKYQTYDTFSLVYYKQYLLDTFGVCWCINNDRDIIVNKALLATTKKELSDTAFRMMIQMILHGSTRYTQNDIMHICDISRMTFYRQIKVLLETKMLTKTGNTYILKNQIGDTRSETILKDGTWQYEKHYQHYYYNAKALQEAMKLDKSCLRIYMKICALKSVRDNSTAEITQETIAKWLDVERQVVLRAVDELCKIGFLEKETRKFKQNYAHNIYTVKSRF